MIYRRNCTNFFFIPFSVSITNLITKLNLALEFDFFKSFLKNYFGENLLLKTKLLINNGDDLFVKSIFVSCILPIHTHITQ